MSSKPFEKPSSHHHTTIPAQSLLDSLKEDDEQTYTQTEEDLYSFENRLVP